MDSLINQKESKNNIINPICKYKSIMIAYFSGTGCTETVADCLQEQLTEIGIDVKQTKISCNNVSNIEKTDLLIVLSPVYAFSLAEIVEKWIGNLPQTENTSAVIVSVSGGGEVSPNTACRMRSRRLLKRKGYDVIYEKMIVMPSNFATPTPDELAIRLINILPLKVKSIISHILSNNHDMIEPEFQDRIFAAAGRAEHVGAKVFGRFIHVSDSCNGCRQCIKNCPKENISLHNGKVKFGFKCIWCLKCIYDCPCRALSPGIVKSSVLKNGFDINRVKEMANENSNDMNKEITSTMWKGVIEYLRD
nr:EFR1 family ferrodoxin [uncultured Aminipila sp.]